MCLWFAPMHKYTKYHYNVLHFPQRILRIVVWWGFCNFRVFSSSFPNDNSQWVQGRGNDGRTSQLYADAWWQTKDTSSLSLILEVIFPIAQWHALTFLFCPFKINLSFAVYVLNIQKGNCHCQLLNPPSPFRINTQKSQNKIRAMKVKQKKETRWSEFSKNHCEVCSLRSYCTEPGIFFNDMLWLRLQRISPGVL